MSAAAALPLDVLPLILEHLADRRDLCTCAQLSKVFHYAATPLLYRTLDVRITTHKGLVKLQKPEYAKHVRHVSETGSLKALRMYVNLEGFTWSGDMAEGSSGEREFMSYLDILRELPVRELVMRTFYGLSDDVWEALHAFTGLHKVSIWCMEGKPRILQGWSEKLGESLTHLELGRCSGVPASILITVLAHLPRLRALRLKGASSAAILEILTFLPHLHSLDTEYFGAAALSRYDDIPAARLRDLTVRTSTVDPQGLQQLWTWIRRLTPAPSLESFTLNAFSTAGEQFIPRGFLLDMATIHKDTLKHFTADSTQMSLADVECLCTLFPALETLSCSTIWSPEGTPYEAVVAKANNLRTLRFYQSKWRRGESDAIITSVRNMMLRESSVLRLIGIGNLIYIGRWVCKTDEDGTNRVEFDIVSGVMQDTWD
ncbi:uncharacterized protein BXZ73DRAFT_95219 [Epithele typhae]|uniref:uncharacterized protein n=1 Tax=Epithele typhae TaxID=378194 RepID=UPI0020088317|nr:uncharacterized protein BXZ73DRAFT_95219 [Epithele typhae]KAH9896408.1 hypothetical protein BXZ73DRAFT_95219 [Epithele typhae]